MTAHREYSGTCGCGHVTPWRNSEGRVILDQVLHDLTRHFRKVLKEPRLLFTVKDEDGDIVHRFQREWDDSNANHHWARYDDTHDCTLWTDRTWTTWGFGPELTYYEHWQYDREVHDQRRWSHWDFRFTLGPWHMGLQWHVKAKDDAPRVQLP